jgi:hypothetical protein
MFLSLYPEQAFLFHKYDILDVDKSACCDRIFLNVKTIVGLSSCRHIRNLQINMLVL